MLEHLMFYFWDQNQEKDVHSHYIEFLSTKSY